jgi:phospholipid-binding lipoprotein MlaA
MVRVPLLPLLLLPLLAACAHSGDRLDRVAISPAAVEDRWEPTNRRIFRASTAIDRAFFVPVADTYRLVVPEAARRGIGNAYDLLQEPTNLANAVAQGKIKSAFRALDRILVNGVLGLGVADHASDMGLTEQPHDFGQTMAVWGMPSGPFVMLPFLGPSTVRDGTGFFVDFLFDPVDLVERRALSADEQLVKLGVRLVDTRSGLRDQGEQLLVGAADPYATVRSAWLQLRRYEIFDGTLPDDPDDAADDEPIDEALPDDAAVSPEPAPSPSPAPGAGSATTPSTPAVTDPEAPPSPG